MRQRLECARDGCSIFFDQKTHNQKYCSDECCRIATNAKIMERYYQTKDRRSGKPRNCLVCSNLLSRYNMGDNCSSCESKTSGASKARINKMMENVV